MKMFDEVAVVCDHRTVESAQALRAVLEHFRLRVRLHRLVQRGEALNFFAGHAPSCPYTVLMSLGTGGENGGLRFEVVEQEHGDPQTEEGWREALVDLTPRTIPNLVTAAGGTLVAVTGRESLVQPFLTAGYDAVIALTESESAMAYDAALLFTIGFFYFAMSEDAATLDPGGPVYSDEQAVAQAAALDSAHRYGTGGYRYYKRAA